MFGVAVSVKSVRWVAKGWGFIIQSRFISLKTRKKKKILFCYLPSRHSAQAGSAES